MNLCVIPARGGSKRIPRKNIREFCGRPMITWTIETVLQAGIFDRIVVSTEDEEISTISLSAGAEVPFIRPVELSGDYVTTTDVMLHAIETLQGDLDTRDTVFCVYATNPFLQAESLKAGWRCLTVDSAPAAYTVATFPYPIYRARKINSSGELEMIFPEHTHTRSQDLPEAYQDAGQFYCAYTIAYKKHRMFAMPGARPVVLPRYQVQDIDTEEDWVCAERLFQLNREAASRSTPLPQSIRKDYE